VDGWHGKTHLRPECRDDEFLPASFIHCFDNAAVFPRVDECAVNRLLIRKDSLELLEKQAAAILIDCGENRGDAERLRSFRERCDVVDDDCGIVTVYVCQLKWLVVDQEKDRILRVRRASRPIFGTFASSHPLLPKSANLSEGVAQFG